MGKKTCLKRRLKVYERDNGVCHLCGCPVPHPDLDTRHPKRRATVDHIVPSIHGGTDALDNLKLAHANCNHARGDLSLASPLLRGEIATAIESNKKWADNARIDMEKKQNLFDARRRGAIQALKKISDWAFECMEGEDASGFAAYENCHVTCENLIAQFEAKKGPDPEKGPFRWITSAANLLSLLHSRGDLPPETNRLIDTLLQARKDL